MFDIFFILQSLRVLSLIFPQTYVLTDIKIHLTLYQLRNQEFGFFLGRWGLYVFSGICKPHTVTYPIKFKMLAVLKGNLPIYDI